MLKIYYPDLMELAKRGEYPCNQCTMGWESQTVNTRGETIDHSCKESCKYYELYKDVQDGEKTRHNYLLGHSMRKYRSIWKRLAKV